MLDDIVRIGWLSLPDVDYSLWDPGDAGCGSSI